MNDIEEPEIDVPVESVSDAAITDCFVGGRSDADSNWEGRIDEVAVFDRAVEP